MPTVTEAKRQLTGIAGHVAIVIWQRADIQEIARDIGIQLSPRAADDILEEIHRHHDCSLGISWMTLVCAVVDWRDKHSHYHRIRASSDQDCIIPGEKIREYPECFEDCPIDSMDQCPRHQKGGKIET